tara:strand:- start:140 stop:361 length:222 start_codon:yes stop_codon:yes gene_type:complete
MWMNEELEKWIIMCCVLILIMVGVVGCAKPQVMHDQPKQPTTLETIGKLDAIANVLGCMFDPTPCQEKSKEDK